MSDFPSIIAQEFGVTIRTVRRWCESGKVPGAYKIKGGHWRLRKLGRRQLEKFDPFETSIESRVTELVWILTTDICRRIPRETLEKFWAAIERSIQLREKFSRPLTQPNPDFQKALEFSYLCRGISQDDLRDRQGLKKRDAKKWQLLAQTPLRDFMHPRAYEAVRTATARLTMAAEAMRQQGIVVTPSKLAQAMGISVATLYRKYTQKQVRDAWASSLEIATRGRRKSANGSWVQQIAGDS